MPVVVVVGIGIVIVVVARSLLGSKVAVAVVVVVVLSSSSPPSQLSWLPSGGAGFRCWGGDAADATSVAAAGGWCWVVLSGAVALGGAGVALGGAGWCWVLGVLSTRVVLLLLAGK